MTCVSIHARPRYAHSAALDAIAQAAVRDLSDVRNQTHNVAAVIAHLELASRSVRRDLTELRNDTRELGVVVSHVHTLQQWLRSSLDGARPSGTFYVVAGLLGACSVR